MIGELFSIACLGKPIPWDLADRFAAGIGHGMHRAHSSGVKVPIFLVFMGIGGDFVKVKQVSEGSKGSEVRQMCY